MKIIHKELAAGKWFTLSFFEQMANIGSEVERAIAWKKKGSGDYAEQAFERALELLDLTITDKRNRLHLKELTRLREMLGDFFVFDNQYQSSDKAWQNYFYPFFFAARINC